MPTIKVAMILKYLTCVFETYIYLETEDNFEHTLNRNKVWLLHIFTATYGYSTTIHNFFS